MMMRGFPILVGVMCLLGGCASQEIQRKDGTRSVRAYTLDNLAKSDVDMIAELSQREAMAGLRRIAEKLYRRNPQEYRKAGLDSVDAALARLFDPAAAPGGDWRLGFVQTFQADYAGDRVGAFMSALQAMLMAAYDNKTAFFMTDSLAAQKLYNSARNVEVAAWKLSHATWPDGTPVLLSNSMDGEIQNLSFEREFGKLIACQDLLALVIEDRDSRTINRVVQNAAAFVFLPI